MKALMQNKTKQKSRRKTKTLEQCKLRSSFMQQQKKNWVHQSIGGVRLFDWHLKKENQNIEIKVFWMQMCERRKDKNTESKPLKW